MVTRAIALMLAGALALPGCVAASRRIESPTGARLQSSAPPTITDNRTLLAEYVQKLPVGARVRVHLHDGGRKRGTLMDATSERLVVQPRTRIPEPPLQIPLDRVIAVEVESGNGGIGRAIGIGIAVGAGTFFGVMLLLAAIYAD